MNKLILSLLVLLTLESANAGQVIDDAEIDNIRVRQTVSYVKFSSCTNYSKIYIEDDYDKIMLSLALTSAAADKKVRVEFDGDDCSSSELTLIYLDTKF